MIFKLSLFSPKEYSVSVGRLGYQLRRHGLQWNQSIRRLGLRGSVGHINQLSLALCLHVEYQHRHVHVHL